MTERKQKLLEEIFTRHLGYLRAIAWKQAKKYEYACDNEDIEEIVARVIDSLVSGDALDRYEERCSLTSFLFLPVKWALLDYFESEFYRLKHHVMSDRVINADGEEMSLIDLNYDRITGGSASHGTGFETVLDRMEAAELRAALQEAIASLWPEDQVLYRMVREDGITQGEAARILGITQPRVSERLARIESELARFLEREHGELVGSALKGTVQ